MISKSLIEMIKGRWREFVREPSAIIFVISMPVIWMVILGLSFSGNNAEKYTIGIVNDPTGFSIPVDSIKSSENFIVSEGNFSDLQKKLNTGKINLLINWDINSKSIVYNFDATNPTSKHAKSAVNDILQKANGRLDVVASVENKITTPGSRYIDFLIPGLLALSIVTTSFFGTGMTIVLHRRDKLLKLYLTTPMNSYEYLLSHIIGRYLMLTVEFFVIFITGMLLFDFAVSGSLLLYIAFSLLGTAAFTALSIYFGARGENTASYNGKVNLLVLSMMMLSGIWFSRSAFPIWLHNISDYLPLTALVDGLRKIALEGSSITDLYFEIGLLFSYVVVGIVAAKARFRWF